MKTHLFAAHREDLSLIVEAIHLASVEGGDTFPVSEVQAIVGFGLEGDRLVNKAKANGKGRVAPEKQVTLIEAEALEALKRDYGVPLSAAECRRNICTRGVALNHLVERLFRIGQATLRGIELCEPCGYLEKLSQKKGVTRGLIHRGGLRAGVVTEGVIRVGDSIQPLEDSVSGAVESPVA